MFFYLSVRFASQERYSEEARLVLSRFTTKEAFPDKEDILVDHGKILKAYD